MMQFGNVVCYTEARVCCSASVFFGIKTRGSSESSPCRWIRERERATGRQNRAGKAKSGCRGKYFIRANVTIKNGVQKSPFTDSKKRRRTVGPFKAILAGGRKDQG